MTSRKLDRRRFIAAGTAAAFGALAGCSGDGGDGGGGDGGGTSTQTPTGGQSPTGDGGSSDYPAVDQFLSNVSNYDGVTDKTGSGTVTVKVGAQGNGGNFAFEPPAVKVDSGTTVRWEWTGKGGQHNVVSQGESDFEFDSGQPKQQPQPFEHKFDATGVGLYVCEPHSGMGMKGAVIVE